MEPEAVNAGRMTGGSNLTAHATVSFDAVGAVVSIEDQPNPPTMSNVWALKAGAVTIPTPTPGGTGSPSSTTPAATSTP